MLVEGNGGISKRNLEFEEKEKEKNWEEFEGMQTTCTVSKKSHRSEAGCPCDVK